MIEVLSSFNCTSNTFFLSVNIMDSFLNKSQKSFEMKDIHLVGVTSMLIASKMEEIIPFKVSTVVDKMTHNKIKSREIIRSEEMILRTVGFELLSDPSLYVYLENLSVLLNMHNQDYYRDLMKILNYISKMVMHDYNFIRKHSLKYIAASCMFIAFKLMEQMNKNLKPKILIEKMKSKLKLSEQTFFATSEQALTLAKNFEKLFPYAKNLAKFDSFVLENLSNK